MLGLVRLGICRSC